ncbi:MAG: hypothetical protein HRT74_13170 [Flavobacteriales bacterium]|nr:hypothetical protein [Flavobacteriales bacterium]
MKYWNLSYNDPKRWNEVFQVSGARYKFFERIKAKASGSPRSVLKEAPNQELDALLKSTTPIKYCNWEVTKNGGILYVRVLLETYGIPVSKDDIVGIEEQKMDEHNSLFLFSYRDGSRMSCEISTQNASKMHSFLNRCFPGKLQ